MPLWMLMCAVYVMLFLDSTSLICASIKGHLPVVKLLLEHNANIEAGDNYGIFLNFVTAVLSSS